MTHPAPHRRLRGTPARIGWVLGLVALAGLLAVPASAQRESGSWTLGPQVGRPGGLTAKLYRPAPIAYDAILTIDGDDFVRLAVHRLWERPLPSSPMHLYYGPGLSATARQPETDPGSTLGVGGKVGLNFYAERFEVFLHAAPAVRVWPRPAPRLGLGVGLRYDFRRS